MAKKKTYESKVGQTLYLFANRKANSCESRINIKPGEQLITNQSNLSELFNYYYVTVASNLKEPITLSDNEFPIESSKYH